MTDETSQSTNQPSDYFPNSRWTMIRKAQGSGDTIARQALNELCTIYWHPIYIYIRHSCGNPDMAEDLTQGYFLDILERGYLAQALQEKGKFRAFLLADVKLFLCNEGRKLGSLKRGGGVHFVPIHGEWTEHEPTDNVTPDQLFDRQWAMTLLARVMNTLRENYESKQRLDLFDALKQFISWNAGDESYASVAVKMGCDENYVKQNVHRLRKHYRKILEDEVAQTVHSGEDVAAEIRYLAASLC